jgi:hypothetical protein
MGLLLEGRRKASNNARCSIGSSQLRPLGQTGRDPYAITPLLEQKDYADKLCAPSYRQIDVKTYNHCFIDVFTILPARFPQ